MMIGNQPCLAVTSWPNNNMLILSIRLCVLYVCLLAIMCGENGAFCVMTEEAGCCLCLNALT